MKPRNLTGVKFGRLTGLRKIESESKHTRWEFLCECGALVESSSYHVTSGRTKSCGCLKKQVTAERSLTHGNSVNRTVTRELKSYQHAKSRCYSPTNPKFPWYGGRGIKMCDRWLADPAAFLMDMGPCPEGCTIDRIDPDGDYCPENCRWATNFEQARTRTDNVWVLWEGKEMILKDYAALRGLPYKTLWARLKRGKSLEDASQF